MISISISFQHEHRCILLRGYASVLRHIFAGLCGACADTAPPYVQGNIAAQHHALVVVPHDYGDVMELVEGEDASRVHNQLIALEVLTKMRIMRELA